MRVVPRRTRSTPRSAIVLLAVACGMFAAMIGASSASAAVNGALKQLPLPSGCLDDAAAGGCGNIVAPMRNVGEPAMLPNGSMIYVPARESDTLNFFSRNANTGALTEKGCFSFAAAAGCTATNAAPLEDATAAAVSPDGKDLYVVGGAAGGSAPDGIVHFTLGADGTPSFGACFAAATYASSPCGVMPVFDGGNPASVAVSPDGQSVYVGNYSSNSIVVFKRNTATGALNQVGLSNAQKCVKRVSDANGCTVEGRLGNVRDIEVTPDNKQVVTGNPGCPALPACYMMLAFDRTDATTGALTVHAANGACISGYQDFFNVGCMNRSTWYGPPQFAMSADGTRLYSVTRPDCCGGYGSLFTTTRNPANGNFTPNTSWCIEAPGAFTDCANSAQSLPDVFDVAIGPNGDVYTAAYGGQRIGIFSAAADGTLTPKGGAFGCLATTPVAGACNQLVGGTNVEYVQPSPDGKNVYGFGLGKIWSFAVDHAPVCDTTSVDTPHNTTVTITLPCSDADGDPLNYEIVSQPAKGTFGAAGIQGNKINYAPLIGTSGPDSFQYRATGAGVQADTATMTVNVGSPPPPSGGGGGQTGGNVGGQTGGGGGQTGGGGGGQVDPTQILFAWPFAFSKSTKKYTVFTALALKAIPIGATVKVVCKAPKGKCPGGSSFTKKNAFGTVKLKKWIKKKIRAGTKMTATVTKPGNYIGAVKIMTVRKKNRPKFTDRCLPPGTTRPVGC
jgi:DNA-binding beta-propeller fold protein YncE